MDSDFDDTSWSSARVIAGIASYGRLSGAQTKLPIAPWLHIIPRDIPMLLETEIFPTSVVEFGDVERTLNPTPLEKDVAAQMVSEAVGPLMVGTVSEIENILQADGKAGVIQTNTDPGPVGIGLQDIYVVVDFGKEVTGYPRIRLDGSKGCTVDMGYSELLINGRVVPHRGGVKFADRYVMKDGPQTWEYYARKGFRYMQLTFRDCPRPVKGDSVSVNFTSYPVGNRAKFSSSDEMLNKIWETSRYTVQLCMHDVFEDCPWREQRQWVEDGRVQVLINYYAFGDTQLPANFLRQIARSQTADGQVATVHPGNPTFAVAGDTLEWLMTVRDHYWDTGDAEFAKELYPQMVDALRGIEYYLNKRNLLEHVPYRIFLIGRPWNTGVRLPP